MVTAPDAEQPDEHHQLGVALANQGKLAEAVSSFQRALQLNPNLAAVHNDLGAIFLQQGQVTEAIASFRRALGIDPNRSYVHNNLGYCLLGQGQFAEARICLQEALRLNPSNAAAHNNLGNVFSAQKQFAEAEQCYRQALRLSLNYPDAHYNLGNVLVERGELFEATACYRQALRLNPSYIQAHNNLGNILKTQGQFAEAVQCFRQALLINPRFAEAHNNLGNALAQEGHPEQAIECFRLALQLSPNHAGALSNLGICLKNEGRLADAADCFRQALATDPSNPLAIWNRSLLRLLQGDLQGGWPDYEQRLTQPGKVPRRFPRPGWDGSELEGKTILVYAEQGLGDTLQFVRYLPLVQKGGGRVVFESQSELMPLLAGTPGIDHLVSAGEPLPCCDVEAPLLSLPGIFGTTMSTIPANVPYLRADPRLVEQWRKELHNAASPLRIGIAWQGTPRFPGDRYRSVPLSHFEQLASVPGVQLVSLQKGAGVEQLRSSAARLPVLDLSERLETFSDTAAVMMNLDLIISSCTAVPHLAGALGVPVWTVLQFVPDWRWFLDREDSPWYPSMRLFRQKKPGDWSEVFAGIAGEVRNWANARHP